MKGIRRAALFCVLALFVGACVTVNIYFPAAQVERTAEQIVDDVYGQPAGQPAPAPQTTPQSGPQSMLTRFFALVGPSPALAQDATSVSNAAIRSLKEQVSQHHQLLLPYYDLGAVGIARNGLLELRDSAGLPMAEIGKLKRLVALDNDSRRQLYQEVARALSVDPSQEAKVGEIFADKWQEGAQPGWWVQGADGQWRKK